MGRPFNKPVVVGILLFAVVVATGLFIALRQGPSASGLPNPNGYADLLKASQQLNPTGARITSDDELRVSVTSNAPVLILARTGLSRECRVPLVAAAMWATNLPPLKTLGQAFINEGKLAEIEHRPTDAARSYVDAMRLGQAISRGGTIIDCLVGMAIESMGSVALEKLIPDVPPVALPDITKTLKELQSRRESMDSVLRHEHEWAQKTFGLKGLIVRFLPATRKTEKAMASRLIAHTNRVDRLIVRLESSGSATR